MSIEVFAWQSNTSIQQSGVEVKRTESKEEQLDFNLNEREAEPEGAEATEVPNA